MDPQYPQLVASLKEAPAVQQERRNFDLVGQNPWIFFVEKTKENGFPILKRVEIDFSTL
jgi:hypothetical protein